MGHMPLHLRKALRKARKATAEALPATAAEWIAIHGGSAKQCDIARRRMDMRIGVKSDPMATAKDKRRVTDQWTNREPLGQLRRGRLHRSDFTDAPVTPTTRFTYVSL